MWRGGGWWPGRGERGMVGINLAWGAKCARTCTEREHEGWGEREDEGWGEL